MYILTYLPTYIHTYMCIYIFICIFVSLHLCMHVRICMFLCIRIMQKPIEPIACPLAPQKSKEQQSGIELPKASLGATWTSKMAKIVDPTLPVLSILGYRAIILGSFGGPGTFCFNPGSSHGPLWALTFFKGL